MKGRYFLASFFGGLIGAGCVLVVVYVTNAKTLVIDSPGTDAAIETLHTRIKENFDDYKQRIKTIYKECQKILNDAKKLDEDEN